MPERFQRRRDRKWRHLCPDAVIVDRTTKWGNPFAIGEGRALRIGDRFVEEFVTDRETAVRFFREMLAYPVRPFPSDDEIRQELRGKDLVCACPLDGPCHADVLMEIANR